MLCQWEGHLICVICFLLGRNQIRDTTRYIAQSILKQVVLNVVALKFLDFCEIAVFPLNLFSEKSHDIFLISVSCCLICY